MNKVELIGRMTKDAELRQTSNGLNVTSFTIAIPRRKSRDESPNADFVNCTAFNRNAENITKYFKKGQRIAIVGRLQSSSYEVDGKRVYRMDVIVDEVDFIERKEEMRETVDDDMPF